LRMAMEKYPDIQFHTTTELIDWVSLWSVVCGL
jgi:hypothetical protein